jgi:predicted aspartyl protease
MELVHGRDAAGPQGASEEVNVIMIKHVTVEGRVLTDVEASVSKNPDAPILLGVSALNRLGKFTLDNGRLVFTGEQPA